MTIKEMEQRTGLTRSNIRFYEKEKLISPVRNTGNGYREYTEEDVKNIKKIAYLRTLGISIEDIRKLSKNEVDLYQVLQRQRENLEQQLSDLKNAKIKCERMLESDEKITYEDLDIEQYVANLNDYWKVNTNIFQMDSIRFFHLWGGNIVWVIQTIVCFLVAVLSIGRLPDEIPIQWSHGVASSFTDCRFIFAFPIVCIIIRFFLRPFISRWLKMNIIDNDALTDYIVNFLCFIALSVEIFIILYVKGTVRYVTTLLFADTFVLIGLLLVAMYKMRGKKE